MNTALALGAGASRPYGFTLGRELMQQIVELLPSDPKARPSAEAVVIIDALDELQRRGHIQLDREETYLLAVFRLMLTKKQPRSIDDFLSGDFGENTEAFRWIGKLAIAYTIGRVEDWEKLAEPPLPSTASGRPDDWYRQLWDELRVSSVGHFCAVPLKTISFNYDRSFDAFLAERLTFADLKTVPSLRRGKQWWSSGSKELRALPLVHPYGVLGTLEELEYGALAGAGECEQLIEAASRIRVIGAERHADEADPFDDARRWIAEADRLVFLGFGFDRTNMVRLGLEAGRPASRRPPSQTTRCLYATTFGFEVAEREALCWRYFKEFRESTSHGPVPVIAHDHIDLGITTYLRRHGALVFEAPPAP